MNAKCGIELKALVPFKTFLPMNCDILAPFSSTSFSNELNILKLKQLNHQMTICIYKGDLIGYKQKVEHFKSFFVFLAAGLGVEMSSESLNFLNASNTEKQIYHYRNMASRLEQNLRLKTLGYSFFISASFFICCLATPWPTFGCCWASSITHPMLITAFGLSVFGPDLKWEGLGLYT